MKGYVCTQCGKSHADLPLAFGCPAPAYWLMMSEAERSSRGWMSDELCVVDEHHFIRGNIEIPIHGHSTPFVWTVWVSLSTDNFERARKLWLNPDRIHEPPYFGWLANALPDTHRH